MNGGDVPQFETVKPEVAPESRLQGHPPPRSPLWLSGLLSDLMLRACLGFTALLVLMPPEGLGWELCACKRVTNAPCPGCGMTRAGANLVRGRVARAIQYHPFGLLLIPIIGALGLLGLAPHRWREAVRAALLPRAAQLKPVYWTVLGGFVLFGVGRWICVVTGLVAFPATWP